MSEFPEVAGPLADPSGRVAAGLFAKYAAPDEILAASPADVFGLPDVASNFADEGRTYPVATPAAAWVSAAHYHASGCKDAAAGERIKAACVYHRVAAEWDKFELAARTEKAAAAPPEPVRYALPADKRYPLDTPRQVKEAAEYFARYAGEFSHEDRRTFAHETVKAAYANSAGLPAAVMVSLEAEAGLFKAAASLEAACEVRAAASPPDLAAVLKQAAAVSATDPLKCAQMLRDVDRVMGFDFTDPLADVARETPTTARLKLAGVVKSANNNWYNAADLEKVPADAWADLFGTPPVMSKEAVEALLTDNEKVAVVEDVLSGYGVEPVERAPRPRADWGALAAAD